MTLLPEGAESWCQIRQDLNRFWALVGDVIEQDLGGMKYADRLKTLLAHRIGLWDVVAEARRTGSLDSNIRDHTSNDLIALIDSLPDLVAIAFNGGTAAKIGERALGERINQFRIFKLPSSSPAYAAVPYSAKLAVWRGLRDTLPTDNGHGSVDSVSTRAV